ncbi:hypothetical protein [Streptomyces sp. NPDC058268]|uniref:hypothetical protein n=1 Tax=Streptomyces sp. NPDC058268 TaxID=3346413 RepID=UPI0036E8424B
MSSETRTEARRTWSFSTVALPSGRYFTEVVMQPAEDTYLRLRRDALTSGLEWAGRAESFATWASAIRAGR